MLQLCVYTNSETVLDVSELISGNTGFSENLNKSGVVDFTFEFFPTDVSEGNKITLSYDNEPYFKGYIFKINLKHNNGVKITAYDQLRYFKTQETYVFENITASEAFKKICNDFGINTGFIKDTKYKLPSLIFDNKNILDIISDCLTATLRQTNQMYYIKDNAGAIELHNIMDNIADIVIDPDWLLYDYDYVRSIDDDTYNQIKLIQDNKTTGTRDVYISKDSDNIAKWGLLQMTEKVDDNLNEEQIKQMADAYLSLKNRITQNLSLQVIGNSQIRAGFVININIPQISINQFLLCTEAKHTFSSTGHTISVTFKMV